MVRLVVVPAWVKYAMSGQQSVQTHATEHCYTCTCLFNTCLLLGLGMYNTVHMHVTYAGMCGSQQLAGRNHHAEFPWHRVLIRAALILPLGVMSDQIAVAPGQDQQNAA